MKEDTYFLSSSQAKLIATKQNRFGIDGTLQMCYYHGDKLESALVNLIHLPIGNLFHELSQGKLRIPGTLDFIGFEEGESVKRKMANDLTLLIDKAKDVAYADTYFLNEEEALKKAKQSNRKGIYDSILQICYYQGKKLDVKLPNLIYLPIDNFLNELIDGKYRIPTRVNFEGMDLSDEVKETLFKSFIDALRKASEGRKEKNKEYLMLMRESKLDFSEPLRFYLPAHSSTQVMQFASKNIADTLVARGYDVLFNLDIGMEDNACHKQIAEFNPHVTININHLNNAFISDDVFNVVWFQDPMPAITGNEEIKLRMRDVIFSLGSQITPFLINKGIEKENIYEQSIKINPEIYNTAYNIKRESKIVFIGGAYDKFDPEEPLILEIVQSLKTGDVNLLELSVKYKADFNNLLNYLYPAVVRRNLIKYICENTNLQVEIYGPDWENYPEFSEYYKGTLEYGTAVAEVYNSATYGIVTNGYYQQRLFEMASCGVIPIVYHSPLEKEESKFKDSCIMIKTLDQFADLIKIVPKKGLDDILKESSYNDMIATIIDLIKREYR